MTFESVGPDRVVAWIELGPDQHTPWGVVHGGAYTTAIESAASVGASAAVLDRGQFAVGVNNVTDFLRPHKSGRVKVVAEPIHQGASSYGRSSSREPTTARSSPADRSASKTLASTAEPLGQTSWSQASATLLTA